MAVVSITLGQDGTADIRHLNCQCRWEKKWHCRRFNVCRQSLLWCAYV